MKKTEDEIFEEFLKANKPKREIYSHLEKMVQLRKLGYSLAQIKLYLQQGYALKTTEKTISRVLLEHKNDIKNEKSTTIVPKDTKINGEVAKESNFFTK